MKTLPESIADAMLWLGIVQPQAHLPPVCGEVVVPVPKAKERVYSSVRDGAEYDGDAEFIEAGKPQLHLFDINKDTDHHGNAYEISASLYEVSADGQSYRIQRYDDKTALREAVGRASTRWDDLGLKLNARSLRESAQVDREKMIEAAADSAKRRLNESDAFSTGNYGGGQDQSFDMRGGYGSGRDASAEYVPVMGGPYSKQLYLHQYLQMHVRAFEAYNHNPIAHQLIEIQTAFVLGRGIDHQSTNNDVDAVWREFTERTNFYQDLENIASDFWWQGEMMLEFYDDEPSKGFTDYRMIDPSTVWEIVTDPEDIQKIFYYHQQYSTPYIQYVDSSLTQNVPMTKYIIRQIPANDVLHIKLNVSKYEKRGRSDLFSVLGWVKRLKDLMNARVIKGQLEAAFVFDIEINAGDAQVAQANMQLPDPFKPGSNWIHNKNAQMKPVTSGIRGSDAAPDIGALLNLISVGFGIPKEFIGEAGKGGRAGALAATEPGTKRFEKRQRMIEFITQAVADRVLSNAVKAGRLNIDNALKDARSVQRLGKLGINTPTRADVSDELQQKNDQAAAQNQQQQADAQKQQAVAAQQQQKLALVQGAQSHQLALQDQKNQHRQALATIKNTATNHSITTTNANVQEGNVRSLRVVNAVFKEAEPNTNDTALTAEQKKRIEAIKQSGKFAKEFLEFIFPSIAQEDRSAKLKDLALAEAMQWLPKSVSATMAAKELNITTYSFNESWAQIVEEAEYGYSMAHVYSQDNQHTPATAMAQDVQQEEQAKQPIAPQNQFTNVPIPPKVAGDKQVPVTPSGGNSVPPGQLPNSGDTKVNKHGGPNANDTDPLAPPHGYSAAANHPMTGAGAAKARGREAAQIRQAIHAQLLKEALAPVMSLRSEIAKTILADSAAVKVLQAEIENE